MAPKKRQRKNSSHDEEEEWFEVWCPRIGEFIERNKAFVKTVAKAVGEHCPWGVDDVPTPEEGWETEIVRMLEQGYCPNGLVEVGGEDELTPLHLAVRADNEAVCRILISQGADVNLGNTCGDYCEMTPLYDVNSEAVCKLLIDAGAKVNERCAWGTPLMNAAERGNEPVVRALLAAGADPTVYATDGILPMGETAAKTARRCGHGRLAKMLDKAERSHPQRWEEPDEDGDEGGARGFLAEILDNRARLKRVLQAFLPPAQE